MTKIDKELLREAIPVDQYYRAELGEPQSDKYFCPFHPDRKTPNLSADEKGVKCFACGEGGDIFWFHGKLKGLPFTNVLTELAKQYAPHLLLSNGNGHQNLPQKEVAQYDYRDEDGELLFQVIRYEPKDFRQRTPDGSGGWIWKLEGVRKVIYRLPQILSSQRTIYIVEGEKDADRLAELGLIATTSPGGAEKWKPEYNEYFKERDVVIIPDNDEPGHRHSKKITDSLNGSAKTIKWVKLPKLAEHEDVSDYLDTHSKDQLLQEIKKTPFYEPSSNNLLDKLETWNHIRELEIKVEWIVDRLIPKESITVLFGKGGIGKTWLMMDIARCIGSGLDYLGYETQQAPVIFIDFENPLAVLNTRTQRLGEAENVHFWRVGHELKPPKLDTTAWEQYKELPDGAVLVFDTLRASHGRDENASNEMASIMEKIKELRDCGFTIILLHHTPKNSDKISKGSTAIVDLSDHILNLSRVRKAKEGEDVLVQDDDDDEEAVYRFGVREKTRFEPHHIYLTHDPDRGFDLAPDPEEECLQNMQNFLLESGPLQKTTFAKECKALGLGEKKARKLVDRGIGRFWKIDGTGQKNAQLVTAILLGSSATPIESAKLPSCSEGELEQEKQESFVL